MKGIQEVSEKDRVVCEGKIKYETLITGPLLMRKLKDQPQLGWSQIENHSLMKNFLRYTDVSELLRVHN